MLLIFYKNKYRLNLKLNKTIVFVRFHLYKNLFRNEVYLTYSWFINIIRNKIKHFMTKC